MHLLQNSELQVGINSTGAELASIVQQRSGLEFMWQGDPQFWGRHSCILFPFIGILKNGTYEYADKNYALGQHGFVRDEEFELVKATSDEIEFMLTSKDDYLHLYPFRFDLSCSYRLEKNTLHIIYKVSNRDEKTMLFSIGAHPGFVVPLKEDAKRSDYYLLFENEEFAHTRRLDQNGLISSEEELVLDHTDRLDITDDLFNNDALIFEDLKSDFLYLVNREGKKIWKFDFTGFPFLGIWSKSEHSPFVCIEPWHGIADLTKSDGLLSNKTGIRSLTANQSFECKHSITIY